MEDKTLNKQLKKWLKFRIIKYIRFTKLNNK